MKAHLPLLLCLLPLNALAVPLQLAHTGRLMDASGLPLTGGQSVALALYDTSGNVVWSDSTLLNFDNGYFKVDIGSSGNPLDVADFSGPLELGLSINGSTELRQQVVSVPFAIQSATTTSLVGGTVDATEITVNGVQVVDTSGALVGVGSLGGLSCAGASEVPVFDGSVWSCKVLDFTQVGGVPTDLIDGDDDALGALICSAQGEVPTWELATGAWVCGPDAISAVGPHTIDTTLSDVEVDAMVVNNPLDLASGSSMDGQLLSTGTHTISLDWTAISGKPAGFDDDIDNDTLALLSCVSDDLAVYNGSIWICTNKSAHTHDGADLTSGTVPFGVLPTGSGANQVAVGDHGHGVGAIAGAQAAITGTCPAGQGIQQVFTDGSVSCGTAILDGGYAQLEGPSQSFAANAWTPVVFDRSPLARDIWSSGSTLFFSRPGVYRVTLSYRNGSGNDVWTGVRLWGGGRSHGTSTGYGNWTNSPELNTVSFLASVSDIGMPYEIQVGRLSSPSGVAAPAAIAGLIPPAVQATLDWVDGTTETTSAYGQLEGPAQVFAADAWTPVGFNASSIANGVASSGSAISFAKAGVYRVTMSYRQGAGGDVWTAVGLFDNSGVPTGLSAGYGNFSGSPELFTTSFLADVSSTAAPFELRFGRSASSTSVTTTTAIAGQALPSVQTTFTRVASSSYAQLEGPGQTFAADSWTPVSFDAIPLANGVGISGTDIRFSQTGSYRVTLSYRQGAGSDVWTAVRLFGGGAVQGISAGYGNLSDSPELFTVSFLANVPDASQVYQVQFGRAGSSTTVRDPSTLPGGVTVAALQATVEKLD